MKRKILSASVVLVAVCVNFKLLDARNVNVDTQITEVLGLIKDAQESGRVGGVYPLNPIFLEMPMLMMEFKCTEGQGQPISMSRRRGNFMTVVNETRTVLYMKVRSDEAHFSFPNCMVDSTTDIIPGFSGIDIQLEGVIQDSDFNIQLTLDHLPTCNATVNAVQVIDMSRISFKIFEGVLPRLLADQISKFLAKYNKKLMDECVVKAVEETVAQLSQVIDLCEIFHPDLRHNDEL